MMMFFIQLYTMGPSMIACMLLLYFPLRISYSFAAPWNHSTLRTRGPRRFTGFFFLLPLSNATALA